MGFNTWSCKGLGTAEPLTLFSLKLEQGLASYVIYVLQNTRHQGSMVYNPGAATIYRPSKKLEKRVKNVLTKPSFGVILAERPQEGAAAEGRAAKTFPEIGKVFVDKIPSACYYIQAAP